MRLQAVLTTLCLAPTGALTVPLAAMAAAPAERSGAAVKVPATRGRSTPRTPIVGSATARRGAAHRAR